MPLGRAAWLSAMIPAIVVALVTCTDDSSKTAVTTDSGSEPSVVGAGECPEVAPKPADGCVLPEGTTCSFGTCSVVIATCSKGLWRFGSNVGETPACPTDFPTSDQACDPCFPTDLKCNYGSTDCTAPDASTNRSVASCPRGKWVIETFPCSDASTLTPPDAGADVQGDAATETD